MHDQGMRRDERTHRHPGHGDRRGPYETRGPERRSFHDYDEFEDRRSAEFRDDRLTDGGIYGSVDYDERRAARERFEHGRRFRYGEADAERYGNHDARRRVPRDETDRLIASDKVEGTAVFDRDRERIGTVENFMVAKRSGRVEYAVLSFGGFMGLGRRHYPVAWEQLTYDARCGGYVIDLERTELDQSPRYRD